MGSKGVHIGFWALTTSMGFMLVMLTVRMVGAESPKKGELSPGLAEVKSDRLQITHTERLALFEGNVHATYHDLILTCDKLRLSYGEDGEIIWLKGEGHVVAVKGDLRATSGTMRLDARSKLLVFESNPQVRKGDHHLSGVRIVLEIDSGKLSVDRARGVFRLSGGGS